MHTENNNEIIEDNVVPMFLNCVRIGFNPSVTLEFKFQLFLRTEGF
jgi:hypothetical protein